MKYTYVRKILKNQSINLLINKREQTVLKYLKDPISFTKYLTNIKNVYNTNNKWKLLIVFDDKIADMLVMKNLNQ